jgi:thiol-disulfide isomerase/thioredoxin
MGCALLAFAWPSVASSAEVAQQQLRAWAGGPKPAFSLTDLEGTQRPLAGNANGVVLVHFFATWCEPCRDELASLRKLVEAHGARVSVLAVNVGEVPARVRRFLDGTALNYPILLDSDRAVTKAWGVHALPTTYVLDGSLVPRLVVEADLDWTKGDVVAALTKVAADASKDGLHSINREERK